MCLVFLSTVSMLGAAVLALSAYLAGEVFFRILGRGPLYQADKVNLAVTFFPALMLAVTCLPAECAGRFFHRGSAGGTECLANLA